MADNPEPKGSLGIMLGAIVAMAAMLFLIGGGEYFGKKTVESDKDLPPVAQGVQRTAPESVGGGPAILSPSRPIVAPPPAR